MGKLVCYTGGIIGLLGEYIFCAPSQNVSLKQPGSSLPC